MKKLLLIAMLAISISSVSLAQRILINKGDQYIGAKLAIGSVAGASTGYVVSYEMGLQQNIGIGASLGYAGYAETSGLFDLKYSSILVLATGTYHVDVLKNSKFDTWAALNLGYNIQSASGTYTGPALLSGVPVPSWSGSASSGLLIGGALNVRYTLSPKLFATASVGFGLGLVNIGIDYRL
jgi:hypothetical protein